MILQILSILAPRLDGPGPQLMIRLQNLAGRREPLHIAVRMAGNATDDLAGRLAAPTGDAVGTFINVEVPLCGPSTTFFAFKFVNGHGLNPSVKMNDVSRADKQLLALFFGKRKSSVSSIDDKEEEPPIFNLHLSGCSPFRDYNAVPV